MEKQQRLRTMSVTEIEGNLGKFSKPDRKRIIQAVAMLFSDSHQTGKVARRKRRAASRKAGG